MEIFDGLEIILTIIYEFLYDKAFNRNKKLVHRLFYIILYVGTLSSIICGLIYLSIILINDKNILFGSILLGISILCIMMLIYPFFEKKEK